MIGAWVAVATAIVALGAVATGVFGLALAYTSAHDRRLSGVVVGLGLIVVSGLACTIAVTTVYNLALT